MATYTDNYTMTKPTYAEQADISVINANMDIIDDVMHSSQISLAPAYDINETYNTGDIVMHELLMYKCLEDNVTGAWDSTKWTRTTAGEESGGGADLDLYGEASGTVEASFSDGAEASLVECEIGIEPQQDLHGYSKPWAGGAGKNKNAYPYVAGTRVISDVSFTMNSDGTITLSGTATAQADYILNGAWASSDNILPSGNYKTYIGDNIPSGIELICVYNTTRLSPVDNVINAPNGITYTFIRIANGTNTNGIELSPMIYDANYELDQFEPYSNICPISGHTDVTVTVASTSGGSGEDTTVSLGRTVYGGTLDVASGKLTVTWDNIASYAGETLTGEWLSSLDEYDALGTPTIGAQVAYELATPQTFTLSKEQIQTLLGQNYVRHDGGGTISLVYVKGDAPIKPNPADAEIPLTGLEIDGEKFKIESGGYQIDTLLNETNGVTVGVTYGFLDGHTLSEYDEIELIIATKENVSGNLGYDRWVMSVQGLLDFPVINYGAYGQRWFHATFTNNSFIQNNTSGDQYPYVYRIYGIKH